jgi:hypothetical protein
MGQITFQVAGDASVGTKAKTFAVADVDVNRLVAWAKVELRGRGEPELTTAQALLKWAEAMMGVTKAGVVRYERRVQAIPPFEAT